ncbi:General stress protein 69 [Rosistilla carotiformis]|uniref:General stress protein 69 n=1 Tax=Rosistilla carotiformis TaxID=2528017 RepID=A0A518JTC6_9BACT|nr:aldo/keto reductase [Rosistilla carotiformis]QDV68785.1 General stress protein 69 [Rosistilla carotiformis]
MTEVEHRALGQTDIRISPVAMGCWPIAGMTSVDVNDTDSLATLDAALESGINFFDTAYCYGAQGESERLIGRGLGDRRDQIVIATKGGIAWDSQGQRVQDASPATLRQQCDESLQRLGTDRVELLYLHGPDPNVPVTESAGELKRLMDEGKTRSVGVSNFNVEQLEAFQAVCPISAVQPHFNMLQREILQDIVPWCEANGASVIIYWPLMKGLLAGKLPRDHQFAPGDGRAKYPMFQGEQWQKNQDFVDTLRRLAIEIGRSVSDLVINWTIHHPGITAALCGAKRPYQITESAAALSWRLTPDQRQRIDQAIADRGPVAGRSAV